MIMLKKTLFAVLAAASLLCLALPASAETFTAENGVLSIDLPNENWKEMQDATKWIVLSDGANMITVDHFSNGETLPAHIVADSHYVNVYEATFSTQNEVFIITGYVVDSAVIPDVTSAILSAKVLQYDTKLAVKKDTASVSEFSIVGLDKTMYATSGVNVRQGASTDSLIIGGLAEGTAVKVTGKVQRNGQDYGWYQINYEGAAGFVSASFLSEQAPAAKPAEQQKKENGPAFTGQAKTIYKSDGTAVTVYEATDNKWYDNAGKGYYWTTTYEFVSADGNTTYSVNKPVSQNSGIYPTGGAIPVYWGNGNLEYITPYSDGYYYSSSWVRYTDGNDNAYYGADGTVLQASLGGPGNWEVEPAYDDSNEEHMLVDRQTGSEVVVTAGGGAYYDAEGTEYSWIDDGGMMDFFGHTYDVRW